MYDYGHEKEDWYDTSQICLNGHIVTETAEQNPNSKRDFCESCGKKTTTQCPKCKSKIEGYHHMSGVAYMSSFVAPRYCTSCGKPYPWTETKIQALKELADKFNEISTEEREKFKESIDDIVVETPKTEIASNRFKLIFNKISPQSKEIVKQISLSLICESAKKLIFGT